MIGRAVRWLDTRTGTAPLVRKTLRYLFPDHWSFLLGEVALFQERRPGVLANCRQMGVVAGEIGKNARSVAVGPADLIWKAFLHGSQGSQPEQERAFRRLLLRHAVPVPRHLFRCLIASA